jgi:hypothetical protein
MQMWGDEKAMMAYLSGLPINAVQNGLERRIRKARLLPGFFVILESGTHALRPKVKGVAERLMDSLKTITTGHEDLTDMSATAQPSI